MSFSINKVIIGGALTRNVDLRYTQSAKAVCEFGMAVNEGSRENPETLFVDVVAWGKQAENCNQCLAKGSVALIEGKLKYDTWEDKQSGQKRSKVSVLAQRVQFVGGGNRQAEKQDYQQQPPTPPQPQQRPSGYSPADFMPPSDDDIDGTIPF